MPIDRPTPLTDEEVGVIVRNFERVGITRVRVMSVIGDVAATAMSSEPLSEVVDHRLRSSRKIYAIIPLPDSQE
ncbi:MAG: hypothetical protein ACD_51C00304G0001 [uncultured bacterium]|nr:MAG: hypothetical protein ACD_51C00304G0001 [uncultured bacterium]OGJ47019.1 MAG: hypothetical protein A2244_04745 [Candidatus Peregrinibacteria bacterium RIFOXYA2_FULL_41_18]OGJ48829.1 MAG: hypothetical protein A2344_05745 [Candidatus Peregrinibacteria bacterium RIFOXYB12_FULL_41_12]OGJ53067.1 MAG: hypothetical protein A2448_01010 [Candidatus Peregrinibacteria bacterium RIFOXYC2_FULL_41_22]OGJ53576.1 MAG: hypothetical protein A2336_00700 [Candidatus Peregrinibacteria bacterium RIFOXYB2_FULL